MKYGAILEFPGFDGTVDLHKRYFYPYDPKYGCFFSGPDKPTNLYVSLDIDNTEDALYLTLKLNANIHPHNEDKFVENYLLPINEFVK